jgi:hypothetical protein
MRKQLLGRNISNNFRGRNSSFVGKPSRVTHHVTLRSSSADKTGEPYMYYTLKIPAMSQDLSLRHQFTYQKPDEENGQEYNNIFCVIEVKNENARIVADGFHSKRKADDYIFFKWVFT